ncbi:unnamed protein product, partial [Prunus brigantina]
MLSKLTTAGSAPLRASDPNPEPFQFLTTKSMYYGFNIF